MSQVYSGGWGGVISHHTPAQPSLFESLFVSPSGKKKSQSFLNTWIFKIILSFVLNQKLFCLHFYLFLSKSHCFAFVFTVFNNISHFPVKERRVFYCPSRYEQNYLYDVEDRWGLARSGSVFPKYPLRVAALQRLQLKRHFAHTSQSSHKFTADMSEGKAGNQLFLFSLFDCFNDEWRVLSKPKDALCFLPTLHTALNETQNQMSSVISRNVC